MATSLSVRLLTALFLLFTLSSATTMPARLNSKTLSVWDQLEYNGLPRGLLPNSVTNYTLDEDTRQFTVILPNSCDVQYDYLIRYDTTIKGTLNFGSIKGLKGIKAKTLLVFWNDITAIEADIANGKVEFKIGRSTESYPETTFKDVPSCKKSVSLRGIFPQLEQVVFQAEV